MEKILFIAVKLKICHYVDAILSETQNRHRRILVRLEYINLFPTW